MLSITAYLTLDGTAKDAIAFYEQALGAKVISQMSFGEMPETPEYPISEDIKDRISHAMIQIGESQLMFSDTFPGQPVTPGNLISLCITADGFEKSKKLFDALANGGQVLMPFQETFFSPGYGSVVDKFGVNFQVFTESNH
ncbi:VOC family protein [Gorillibacterium timonense]|uniref:VOC family protein n=1 Tax=Gorillibacterium timonense TaxID=1689269 RepID=UPI00071E10FB|nr:VOC family protein [Gorillibacterium timonense]